MNEIKTNRQNPADDEIDLIALAKTLWKGRKLVIFTTIAGIFLGLVFALFSPKEFTASTTLVPQLSSSKSKLSGLSSLAAMAGFNLDLNLETSELSPYIYPQIVQSVPFQLELMEAPFRFADVEQPVSLYQYYTEYAKPGFLSQVKKYTIGLPFVIIGALKPDKPQAEPAVAGEELFDSPIALTEDQEKIRKFLSERVFLDANDKEGYLVLTVVTHDPGLAAQVAHKAQLLFRNTLQNLKLKRPLHS